MVVGGSPARRKILTSAPDAAAIIDSGGLIVAPTETVYGLMGRPTQANVDRIREIKRRPAEKNIQLLIPDRSWLERMTVANAAAKALADAYWPGPLTLVLPGHPSAPDALCIDGTVGVRVPNHALALDLLDLCGPLAASSANRSGDPTPATLAEIAAILGAEVDGYLDGGTIEGSGSTVVGLVDGLEILREGPLSTADVEAVVQGLI